MSVSDSVERGQMTQPICTLKLMVFALYVILESFEKDLNLLARVIIWNVLAKFVLQILKFSGNIMLTK